MDLKVTSKLLILKGHAVLQFPPVLKRDSFNLTLQCQSLSFVDNEDAINEPFFVVCSGSTYYSQKVKRNVLAMFQYKKEANIVHFDHTVPLTNPQENLEIEIVDFYDKKKSVSAVGVFAIQGQVQNNLLV